jgi:carboxyl-terminal processing protease
MSPIGRHCARPSRGTSRSTLGFIAAALFTALPVSAPFPASAQTTNLGFEAVDVATGGPSGWTAVGAGGRGFEIASDELDPVEGRRTLRLTVPSARGARLAQRVAASDLQGPAVAAGRLLRLSGYARVAAEDELAPALWLRIDGAKGPMFLDSHGSAEERGASSEPAAKKAAGGDWRHHALELPWPADVTGVTLGVSARGTGTVWFDGLRLEGVLTSATPAPTAVAVRYLDDALALMREHALNRESIDWPKHRATALEYLRGARTAADAHLAVRFALRELGDRHSYLQGPAAARALQETAVTNALTRQPATLPSGQRLAAGIGLLAVPGFAGGAHADQVEYATSLQTVIQRIDTQGVCGWIIDLRDNRGGNLWPMLVGLGPLLGSGDLAASIYPDGRRVGVWYREGQGGFGDYVQLRVAEPYRVAGPAPVALLVGSGTASSAEVLVVAFRGREATRSFGAPTRGVSAGNRIFPLTDGASLVLTVAGTSDRFGRVHSGPIEPDELVSRDEEGADAALEAALAWLGAAAVCR